MSTNPREVVAVNFLPLRPGVAPAEFAEFSATLDQPTCLSQPVVRSFDAFTVVEPAPGLPRFDVVEIMRVADWEEWVRVRDSLDAMRPVMAGFDRLVRADAVRTLFARPIHRRP